MQLNNSFTPQFQDRVRSSRDLNDMINVKQNYQQYKSPTRGGYESRYPASYAMSKDKPPVKVNISPPKYNTQSNGYNNLSRSPKYSMTNGRMQSFSQYPQKTYTSPSRTSFIPSPYRNNYDSGPNIPTNALYSNYENLYMKQGSMLEMQKIVSQLRISLQQSMQSQESLQEQLNKQRARSFQLLETKRKLQQQLGKMEFELDRITSSDLLGQRQLMIKYQNQVKESQRLNSQLNEFREQVKKYKKQLRQCMSQNNALKNNNQLLQSHNAQLTYQIKQLTQQFQSIQQQYNSSIMRQRQLAQQNSAIRTYKEQNQSRTANYKNNAQFMNNIKSSQSIIRSQQSILRPQQFKSKAQQNSYRGQQNMQRGQEYMSRGQEQGGNYVPSIANINTTRTNNYQSNIYGNKGKNPNTNMNMNMNTNINKNTNYLNVTNDKINRQNNGINYDIENCKLLEDYNKLMTQNQSMKKLYQDFYQQSSNLNKPPYPTYNSHQSINQEPEQFESTNHHFYHHQQQHYQNHNQQDYQDHHQEEYENQQRQQNTQRLQTFQKNHLSSQVLSLRQQLIHSLLQNYYTQATSLAQQQQANVLILFINLITKNISTIHKMTLNYLQARDIMKKQLSSNTQRYQQQFENTPPSNQYEQQAEELWYNTKQKLKTQLKAHSLPNNKTLNQKEIITLNVNAYFLALFRLLTLIHKYENKSISPESESLNKIKHSALKYIHKIYEETLKLKQNK